MILKCNIPQHNNNNKRRLHLPELGRRRCRYTHSRIAGSVLSASIRSTTTGWMRRRWRELLRPKLCICFQLTAFMHIIIQCAHMYSLTRFMLLQSTSPHRPTCPYIYLQRYLSGTLARRSMLPLLLFVVSTILSHSIPVSALAP